MTLAVTPLYLRARLGRVHFTLYGGGSGVGVGAGLEWFYLALRSGLNSGLMVGSLFVLWVSFNCCLLLFYLVYFWTW